MLFWVSRMSAPKRKRDGQYLDPPSLPHPDEVREHKLYVGNLDKRVTEYHILKLFQPHGRIVREQFMWHVSGPQRGQPRGFAFVEFACRAEALCAKNALDAKTLFGRRLAVRFVQAKLAETLQAASSDTGGGGAAAAGGGSAAAAADEAVVGAMRAAQAASSLDSAMDALRRKLGLAPGQSASSLGTPSAIGALASHSSTVAVATAPTPATAAEPAGSAAGGPPPPPPQAQRGGSALAAAKARLLQRKKDEEGKAAGTGEAEAETQGGGKLARADSER